MADGITIAIGGTALTALGGIVGSWLRARHDSRRIEPQPLGVEMAEKYAVREENERAHANLFARVAAIEQRSAAHDARLDRIENTLDRIDGKMDRLLGKG